MQYSLNEVTIIPFAIVSDEGVPLKFIIYNVFTDFLNTVVYVLFSIEVNGVGTCVLGSFIVIKYVFLCVGST